ncbi:MAG TPA: carbohydrate ABC transporter permease [Burkholderiales bacterium]|nr:carbohydrate ABC transporter permease [Burkholderiales bacterium]
MTGLVLARRILAYVVLLAITFLICFPLIWALSTSLKAPKEVMATPPRLLPSAATVANYRNLITGKEQYFRADQSYIPTTAAPQHFTAWFTNSVIVSASSTLISIVISTLAAYSVTRFRYWGRRIIPYFSLLGYMIPSIILVFPMFLVMAQLSLTNSLWSLTFGYVSITLPFCMWLLWAFFRGIPIELEEAAMIDGASRLRVFADIVLPSALPGIIAAAIFSLIVSWNDFLFARVFINSIENLPLTVGVMHFFEGTHVDWGLMMASAVLMTVPMALLFMLMQRHLVAGFGAGAVKG